MDPIFASLIVVTLQVNLNYDMTSPSTEIYIILVAHVLHDTIDTDDINESRVVELETEKFLTQLNDLVKEYRKTFQYKDEDTPVDHQFLKNLVQESEFNQIITFDDDKLKVELSPQKFQSLLMSILVDSSIRYSTVLSKDVNELTEKYLELRPPIPTVNIVKLSTPVKPDTEIEGTTEADKELEEKVSEKIKVEEIYKMEEEKKETEVAEHATSEGAPEVESMDVDKEEKDDENENEIKDMMDVDEPEVTVKMDQIEPEEVEKEEEEQLEQKEEEKEEKIEEMEEQAEEIDLGLQAEPEQVEQEPEVENIDERRRTEITPALEEVIRGERAKRSHSPQASQKRKRFQNIAINLIKTIEEHRFSSPFLVPVVADQYEKVIYDPKDLKSILRAVKQKDEPAAYETVKELERDIMLMFANCVMYNKSSAHLVDMARQMRDEVKKTFKMFEEAESEIA